MAAIRSVVSTEELATAFSQNQARQHVASLLGGPLGGALYAVRAWAPFAVDAISYCVSCLTLSRIRTDLRPQPREGAPTRPLHQVKEGYRFIRQPAVLPDPDGLGRSEQPAWSTPASSW